MLPALELATASYHHGWSHARMWSLAFTAAAVMRPSATFVGLTRITSVTEPVGRKTPAAAGVGVRRSRCATIIAARASSGTWHVLRTMTVAIDDSRAKAHPSDERRRDASVSLSLRSMSWTAASKASRHGNVLFG